MESWGRVAGLKGEAPVLQVLVSIESRLTVVRDEQGQTMAEYAVVLAVITLVVVGGLMALSGGINGALEEVTGIF